KEDPMTMTIVTPPRLNWGASDPQVRGPVVAYPAPQQQRNAIGGRPYAMFHALGLASKEGPAGFRPDYKDTPPWVDIKPGPRSHEIVTMDPFGHRLDLWAPHMEAGLDVRRSISICAAELELFEIGQCLGAGTLQADGQWLLGNGQIPIVEL